MDADRWSRIEQLYHEAAALGGADRVAFLGRACGDDRVLRGEIESLLAEDGETVTFLDEPALAVAARLVSDDIPVLTGRAFGPYRIDELLGAGGMGDVYRAHDTVLGRAVAIKILPEAFSSDPERLARFEQEAQFLASLSHPNIAAIYGVHESDGLRGLVLELVDGETLRQRIARGPMPLYDAIRIARQVGEGLDAAHQRGIVHRDLKPSNIKIASDGTAKILDFGLAKSAGVEMASEPRPGSVSGEPGGLVVGTASYMSPEQARGDAVDKRTDIWAFGCVCLEMLTGQPAFRKATDAHGDGPRWDLMPAAVPAGVTAALKRCLDEDPKRRRRDIGDVLVDLDEALRADTAPAEKAARSPVPAILAGLLLLAAVAALIASYRPSGNALSSPSFQARLSMLLPPGMDFPEQDSQVAVSPDGMSVAYVAASGSDAGRLFIRRLDATSEQVVGDALNVRHPFFSPDSRWIGFFAGDTLSKASIHDGQITAISPAHRGGFASWSHGFIVFGEGGDLPSGGIRRVSESGGPVDVLSTPNRAAGETTHDAPQLLPDGRTVIYTVRNGYQNDGTFNVVIQSPGKAAQVLIANARFGQYIGNSTLVYQRDRSLFATRFDPETLTVSGSGVMLFDDLSPSGRPRWSAAGGVLAYRPRYENRRLVWVARGGEEISIPSPLKRYAAPNLSPRGDRVAVDIEEDQKWDVWTFDIVRQRLTQLTSDGGSRYPMWTPDGEHVAVVQRRENRLYWQSPDGGASRDLVRAHLPVWLGSWTSDSRTLVFMQEGEGTQSDLWAVDIERQDPARPLVRTNAREYGGRLSPDGRWLTYFSDETGQFELYLTAFAPGGSRHQISNARDQARPEEAVWAKDGRELFFRQGTQMLAIRVPPDVTKAPGRPTVLFEGDYFAYGGPGIVNYDVSPDGQRFLMLKPVEERTPHLTIVQGLDRLVRARLNP